LLASQSQPTHYVFHIVEVVCTRVIPSEAIECEVIPLEVLQVRIGIVPLSLQGCPLDNVYWALVCELDRGNRRHIFHLKTSENEVQYELF